MAPTAHNFYNLNSTRGYPLDDSATGLSDAGARLPDGILVDGCLRFPRTLGQYAYLMAIHATSKLVSCVVGVAEDLDEVALVPIATLTVPLPLTAGRPYPLKALSEGVGGWFVFGPPDIAYSGRFSTPAQSLLLAKIARPYEPLPVPWVSKPLDEYKLERIARLFAGTDIEILKAPRTIDGELKEAIVIRLSGDLASVLPKYAGPCGGRPDSRTCLLPAVEGIANAVPDETGDIQLEFEGLTASPVPNGLLLNTALQLPDLCGQSLLQNETGPEDYCSEISEISESEISESEGEDSESESTSDSSEVIYVTYPKCIRIFSTETAPFDYPYGSWSQSSPYPPQFPCSSFGNPVSSWRSLHAGVTPRTVANPQGSHLAIFNEPEYVQSLNMRAETAVRIGDSQTKAGIVFGYRQPSGATQPEALTAILDPARRQVAIGVWTPRLSYYLVPVSVQLSLDAWYKVTVWFRSVGSNLDLRLFVDYLPVGNESPPLGFPVSCQTVVTNTWPQLENGRFGLLSVGPSTDFGYLHLDQL